MSNSGLVDVYIRNNRFYLVCDCLVLEFLMYFLIFGGV